MPKFLWLVRRRRLCEACHKSFVTFEMLERHFRRLEGAQAALSGLRRREFIRPDEPRRELRVRTERLDAVIPPQIKIDLIKVDVEGAEGLVISGGLDTIKRNRPYIILEHGRKSSAAFEINSEDIYDALVDQCGLRVSLLPDWLSGRRSLTKQEFIGQSEWYFLAHPAH